MAKSNKNNTTAPAPPSAANKLSGALSSKKEELKSELIRRFGQIPGYYVSNGKEDLKQYVIELAAREKNPEQFILDLCASV
jgi:hypothetical protein